MTSRIVSVGIAVCLLPLARPAAAAAPKEFVGQWVWTQTDSEVLEKSRMKIEGLPAAVWVGTLGYNGKRVTSTPALAPRGSEKGDLAIVVRFNDSIDELWGAPDDAATIQAIGTELGSLLAAAESRGRHVGEVQLDYECPAESLDHWAAVIGKLSTGVLAGREVWITSLISNVRRADYGTLFRDKVRGHIIQVFDTGEEDSIEPGALSSLLESRGIPFRVGIAAYDRSIPGVVETHHARWFRGARGMAENPLFRGVWVFPADHEWLPLWEAAR